MMERISRELVESGIDEDIIRFGMQDGALAAHIGDYWFYIAEEGRTEDDFTRDELVSLVHEAVNDEPINADDEEAATECLYYKYFLEEQLGR